MVVLSVKRGEELSLLYQTHVSTKIADVQEAICKIYNSKNRLKRLIDAAGDIVQYGLLKKIEDHGYSIEDLEVMRTEDSASEPSGPKPIIERNGQRYQINPDPTGRRNGEAPMPEIAEIITKTVDSANILVAKAYAQTGNFLTIDSIEEAIRLIGGALVIAYPMGLPEWEVARDILADNEDLSGQAASKDVFNAADSSLWWAGKELAVEKLLCDFIGRNDKTKVIVKLQKKSQGAPVRESPFDEKAQREMMAYYYKKQEEHKKLLENEDEDYVNSAWANPKALKAHFNGLNNLSIGPK